MEKPTLQDAKDYLQSWKDARNEIAKWAKEIKPKAWLFFNNTKAINLTRREIAQMKRYNYPLFGKRITKANIENKIENLLTPIGNYCKGRSYAITDKEKEADQWEVQVLKMVLELIK